MCGSVYVETVETRHDAVPWDVLGHFRVFERGLAYPVINPEHREHI